MDERRNKGSQILHKFRQRGEVLFFGVLLLGGLIGLLFFLRPKTSDVERRELTRFPRPSAQSLFDGSFFADVSLWYADTMPFRDACISLDQKLKRVYGFAGSEQMIGGNVIADEIPGEDETGPEALSSDAVTATPKPTQTPSAEPDSKAMDEEVQNLIQQGLYVRDGAAYEMYYFVKDSADRYIAAINNAAEALGDEAEVYSLLIPNSGSVMLDDEEAEKLGGSDQKQGIEYYYTRYDERIHPVRIFDTLHENRDKYLYFRTDHHWTQLGAYYAYRELCKEKGWTPHELEEYDTMVFSPFLGTLYGSLNDPEMKKKPDEVTAYIPLATNEMTYIDMDGVTEVEWQVIADVSDWGESAGYYCYIGGDKPLATIRNPKLNDGSSCLVIKDSYGDCFVPFLVDHYQTVYVMDFRYATTKAVDFVKEHGIDDLICAANIMIIGSEDLMNNMEAVLNP